MSAGSSSGWAGAGQEPSSKDGGGWSLHHQEVRATALEIQLSWAALSPAGPRYSGKQPKS